MCIMKDLILVREGTYSKDDCISLVLIILIRTEILDSPVSRIKEVTGQPATLYPLTMEFHSSLTKNEF